MNYSKIYDSLISSAEKVQISTESQQRDLEIHWRVPKGVWGHQPEDHVFLTLQQRVVAYKLLAKMHPSSTIVKQTLKDLIRLRGKKKRKIPIKRPSHSAATRAKMSASHMGKRFSIESRLKMSAAKKGRKFTPEHIAARSASRSRNHRGYDEAARLNMSMAAKNRKKPNHWSIAK